MSRTDCALARESVSADLDGELTELDSRRLHAHLRVCADCSVWADQVRVTTTRLRETPVEAPAAAVFDVPRRRRTWPTGQALAVGSAAALVAAFAVALGGGPGSLGGPGTTSTHPRPAEQRGSDTGPAVDEQVPAGQRSHRAVHAI